MKHDAPLARTPTLERLLGKLRRRIALQVWLHGLGTACAAAAAWVLFAFAADYWLRVPVPVRAVLAVLLPVVFIALLWRELVRPLLRLPGRSGLAVLVERPRPELAQLLVSAVELQGRGEESEASPALVEAVLAEAETRARELGTSGVLDERSPRRRLFAGVLGGLLLFAGAAARPDLARIFADHLLGGRTPWPQRTHLALEIPLHDAGAHVEVTPGLVLVRVARGTDVPVIVRAEGVMPSDVTLHFENGTRRVLSPSGSGTFRTLLGSQQENLAFYATGGDDRDGDPRVEIQVLQPPDVEGVAVAVTPPSWTALPGYVAFNRDVEVVAGSRLKIHVLPTPRGATGRVRLLPEDALLDLLPAPFPRDEDDNVASEEGLYFELEAATSVGYRFELVDASGLANPDPGLFRVQVIEDRPPDVRLFAPARSEYETVLGGVIPIRARAEDDFGLVSMAWSVRPERAESEPAAENVLSGLFEPMAAAPEPPAADASAAAGAPTVGAAAATRGKAWIAATRIDVDSLAPPGGELTLDQHFELVCTAEDNHEPSANIGRSTPVRIRLISADELLRRMQDRLARARLDATRLAELQREKERRVLELIDSLAEGGAPEGGDALALHAAAVGQRRVQTDASALARDLAGVAGDVIYARVDDDAAALLEFLDARMRDAATASFQPARWQELAQAFERGELGAPGFTGNLVRLVSQALAVSEEAALDAALALDRAQGARGGSEAHDALVLAHEQQTEALRRIEVLLASLAEWDNFQNVLALTRDILNRSKALRDRTQHAAKESER